MSRTLNYSVVDVFAERAFEGNALAVFHDARSLSDEEMLTLARETNLSETTFILPEDAATEEREGVRVRIFTTQEELPFAGHPTLGTATWLYLNHPTLKGTKTIKLRLNVGTITVRFDERGEGEVGVRATMVQRDPVFGATHDRAEVARAIGLRVEDLSAESCYCDRWTFRSDCNWCSKRRRHGQRKMTRIFSIALRRSRRRNRVAQIGMRGCSFIQERIQQQVRRRAAALPG
jgi:predicted PhzF superfamily epimerase YddE/YHI9